MSAIESTVIPGLYTARTRDPRLVKHIMSAIEPSARDVGMPFEDYVPDVEGCAWLVHYVDEQRAACCGFDAVNSVTVEMHPFVLQAYRRRWRFEIVRAALRWLVENSHYWKVNAVIPVTLPHVRMFAGQMGFTREGIDRESWPHEGRAVDRVRYGITREEIEAQPWPTS